MTDKSDSDLKDIIVSNSYVDEAKQAAAWELEKRSYEIDFKSKQKSKTNKLFRIPLTKESKEWRKFHENRLLAFGIGCVAIALYFFIPDLLTTKSSLTALEGTIKSSKVYVENVSSRNRYGYEAKSRKANLIFYLNEYQKKFELSENIGQEYRSDEYNRLSKRLQNSNQATIWIKNSESNSWNPKVFQIDIDGETELEFESVRTEHGLIFILLLFLGLGSILFVLWRKFPETINRLIGNEKVSSQHR